MGWDFEGLMELFSPGFLCIREIDMHKSCHYSKFGLRADKDVSPQSLH